MIRCDPETIETGDTFAWYFMNRRLHNSDRYTVDEDLRMLTVRNIAVGDEGRYYCRRLRMGNSTPDTEELRGGCLFVYSKLYMTLCQLCTPVDFVSAVEPNRQPLKHAS